MGLMSALIGGIAPRPHTYTSWRRYHERPSRTKDGCTMTMVEMSPSIPLTYLWGAEAARDVNRKLIDDAALAFGVNRSRIVLLDLGRERVAWVENGDTAEVLRYVWVGGTV